MPCGNRQYRYLITEHLDYKIDDYMKSKEAKLKFGQICVGMLRCLQALHKKSYIHRNIRDSSFRIHNHKVYLVDFREAKQFMINNCQHIQREVKDLQQTSSVFFHESNTQSRRDDLVSMVYSALYIIEDGKLPWSNYFKKND